MPTRQQAHHAKLDVGVLNEVRHPIEQELLVRRTVELAEHGDVTEDTVEPSLYLRLKSL